MWMIMKKCMELPLIEPVYRTFNFDSAGSAIAKDNPSIRNWYLNEIMITTCSRDFIMTGYTSPKLWIVDSVYTQNPHITRKRYEIKYLGSGVHAVIRNFIDDGFYVFFWGMDDYYFKGKSWYHEKHAPHDGMIIGYDTENDTYTVYAYDKRWILQKFKTPKRALSKAIKSGLAQNHNAYLDAIKVKTEPVSLCPETICKKLKSYLDSSLEKYPPDRGGTVYGIAVHEYLVMYLEKLFSEEIPYERMDRRICRFLWEHKKVMLERIVEVEKALSLGNEISSKYKFIVKEAENMRMMYASFNHRRRNSLLMDIKDKLLYIHENEKILLTRFVEMMEQALEAKNKE